MATPPTYQHRQERFFFPIVGFHSPLIPLLLGLHLYLPIQASHKLKGSLGELSIKYTVKIKTLKYVYVTLPFNIWLHGASTRVPVCK